MSIIYGRSAVCMICGKLQSECMGFHEDDPKTEWFRKSIAEEMTRKELEDRLVEQHEIIAQLKQEIDRITQPQSDAKNTTL